MSAIYACLTGYDAPSCEAERTFVAQATVFVKITTAILESCTALTSSGKFLSDMATVLIYGSDARLVETRQWVLEHSAFQVEPALRLTEVEEVLSKQKVDLLVLCHSFSEEDCAAAMALIESQPKTKTLILSLDLARAHESKIDAVLSSVLAPQTLIATVRTLTGTA